MNNKLKKLRDRIDWLDVQIASLLNERMRAADEVGKIKKINRQDVADLSREKSVLNHVERVIQHPILKANISSIYREIMQESRATQQFFQHPSQPFRRIGIIGVGLMGGSICKALKIKDPSIEVSRLTYHTDENALAEEGGWVDRVYSTLADLVQNSELIILACPISTIIGFAEEIKNLEVPLKCIVIDIASVKGDIVEAFEKLTCEKIEFISTHPMAGKEQRGFSNSQATLFVDRPWIVVPHKKNSSSGLDCIEEWVLFLGSKPVRLEADVHDRQAALISHLPLMLAKLYYDFVHSMDPESIKIAGPGFEAFTRLAHDNREMREEISKYNSQVIRDYLNQWVEYLK